MPRPRLCFFVELPSDALGALFSEPELVAWLAEHRCALSMGLLDLSADRAALVRRIEAAGVPVAAWLLVSEEDGYWLNADNASAAAARWREVRAWAEQEQLAFARVGLDVEPPRARLEALRTGGLGALVSSLRARRTREDVAAAEADYGRLVEEIRSSGRSVESYHFPLLLDERAVGSTLLRRTLGLVDVPADSEVHMLYASYLGRAAARSYFSEAPCIALGVTGGGVHAEEPDARRRPLAWEALEQDLRAAAAACQDVYVFSLEGCVARGFLERIAAMDWEGPAPGPPRVERAAASAARSGLRAFLASEPLLDRLEAATGRLFSSTP